jgi:hypothetical protein
VNFLRERLKFKPPLMGSWLLIITFRSLESLCSDEVPFMSITAKLFLSLSFSVLGAILTAKVINSANEGKCWLIDQQQREESE